jgi:hypothetical protein
MLTSIPADSTFRPKYADEMSKQAKRERSEPGKEVGEKWKNNFAEASALFRGPQIVLMSIIVASRGRSSQNIHDIRHTKTPEMSQHQAAGAMWVNEQNRRPEGKAPCSGKRCLLT